MATIPSRPSPAHSPAFYEIVLKLVYSGREPILVVLIGAAKENDGSNLWVRCEEKGGGRIIT